MSSNIRFIRIEVSGTTLVYILMFHFVNPSLVIPFTSGLSLCRPIICLCFQRIAVVRQIIISSQEDLHAALHLEK